MTNFIDNVILPGCLVIGVGFIIAANLLFIHICVEECIRLFKKE